MSAPAASERWRIASAAKLLPPICSLFNGRLVDKTESPMPETRESLIGKIEHKVFMFDNLILLVVEMKHSDSESFMTPQDSFAQVFLELLCEILSLFATYSASD